MTAGRLMTPDAADEPRAARGFFAHHGFWALGVRLFRQLDFSAKAALITLAFVLPLLLLGWAYVRNANESIDFARQERAGVKVLKAIDPWLIEVQVQRRLTMTGQVARPDAAAIEARLKAVREAVASSGLDVKALVAGIESQQMAVTRLDDRTPLPEAAAALQKYVDAVMALRTTLLDLSNLTLDPDQDTYYLMRLATDVSSGVVEAVSRSRAEAGRIARAGAGDSAAAVRELYGVWYLGQSQAAAIEAVTERAVQANAGLARRIPSADAERAARAFFAASSDAWFKDAFRPDVAALDPIGKAAVDALRKLSAESMQALDELLQARIERTEQARAAMLGVAAASLLLAAYLFYSFYLVMRGGLAEVGRHLQAMTGGDLTTTPRPWGRDEAASLMHSIRDMQASLRGMVAEVRQASAGIVQASSEIADSSDDLSTRTEKTAANLQQSASAMEEIGATVRQANANAQEATQFASDNAAVAEQGGEVIKRMVQNMEAIQSSSRRIGEIIGTIDSIAFQTNILSLNAAVEAARAGEQGRGFAVVAAEVRVLAQNTATAAKEIKSLITSSVDHVDAGTEIVRQAGHSMGEIVRSAGRVNELLNEIAIGAHQQNDGIQQVSGAVQELDKATQQNAAMVEQTAAAASALRSRAVDLASQVERFRLPA